MTLLDDTENQLLFDLPPSPSVPPNRHPGPMTRPQHLQLPHQLSCGSNGDVSVRSRWLFYLAMLLHLQCGDSGGSYLMHIARLTEPRKRLPGSTRGFGPYGDKPVSDRLYQPCEELCRRHDNSLARPLQHEHDWVSPVPGIGPCRPGGIGRLGCCGAPRLLCFRCAVTWHV